MGTSSSARQLAGKLTAAAHNIDKSRRVAIIEEAVIVKESLLRAPGAPHVVANRKAGVRYDLRNENEALVRWTGPVHLVNNPTRAHQIQPRGFAGTRSTGTRAARGAGILAAFGVDARRDGGGALRLADGNVRRRVSHPGTSGKRFFQAGRTVAERLAPKAYQRRFHSALAEVFL